MAGPTPFQTVGPFFHRALPFARGGTVVCEMAGGHAAVIEGTLRDGSGEPAADALVETWQADPEGRYHHPDDAAGEERAFDGFARVATDAAGRFTIETVKPGRVPGPGRSRQAPHLVMGILARGLLTRLVTRLYFEDEPSNEQDPILALVPKERRATLIARRTSEGLYRFDVVLQGEGETVFFDV
jgi:protocatechuate 3,4-dioxygenase, alpha subunit